MTIIDDAKPILDEGFATIDDVGLRLFRVWVRTTEWSGTQVGHGAKTVTLRELTVARGGRPRCKRLSSERVVASGGELGDEMYEVTLVPDYPGGGVTAADLTPPTDGVAREVHYLVFGPDCSPTGTVCVQTSVVPTPFRYTMRLRKTGAA